MLHEKLTRRQAIESILTGGAAVATLPLAGCGEKIQDRQIERASTVDMIDALKATGAVFVDSEGKTVNLNGLQAKLNGNPSTISFMFANCIDVCPTTASVLHRISESKHSIQHVIVSVSPSNDFSNHSLANTVEAQGLKVSGPQANTIILYPTVDGTTSRDSLTGGFVKALEIQHKLELWTKGRDVSGHSGAITLFDASGKQVVQAMNNHDSEPMVKQLTQALNRSPARPR